MPPDTSWETCDKWYDTLVGKEGHYYHQHLILPGVLRLIDFSKLPSPSLLDLGCGQGVLARALPSEIIYHGIDASSSLIAAAKKATKRRQCHFSVADICKPLPLKKKFSHVAMILALQNLEFPDRALQNASEHLIASGELILVLNHPCFRIPRQSHWEIDESQKIEYRRVDRYYSPLKIPIQMHPGQKPSKTTWSFHYPLSSYSHWLNNIGFSIELLEEWLSDKKSTGKYSKMENRARSEFPLFLAIKARKRS